MTRARWRVFSLVSTPVEMNNCIIVRSEKILAELQYHSFISVLEYSSKKSVRNTDEIIIINCQFEPSFTFTIIIHTLQFLVELWTH